MKVICSGMSKTGTKSMAAAMRVLGYKVYDFEEQYFYLGDEIMKLLDEGWTQEDLKRIFEDVDVITDAPSFIFSEDLVQAFPDAKVVHMERASEKSWIDSVETQLTSFTGNTITRILLKCTPHGRKLRHFLMEASNIALSVAPTGIFTSPKLNRQLAILRYRQHNSRIRSIVPKDRLLVYKFSDGWKPLCEFLEKPIPDAELPHRNKGGSITQEVVDTSYIFYPIKRELMVRLAGLIGVLGLFIYYILFKL